MFISILDVISSQDKKNFHEQETKVELVRLKRLKMKKIIGSPQRLLSMCIIDNARFFVSILVANIDHRFKLAIYRYEALIKGFPTLASVQTNFHYG